VDGLTLAILLHNLKFARLHLCQNIREEQIVPDLDEKKG
jgi:hypothetical protein